MMAVDKVLTTPYDTYMRKTAEEDLIEKAFTTLDTCPTDNSPLKVRYDVGIGVLRFKFKYCDTCGLVKELGRGK